MILSHYRKKYGNILWQHTPTSPNFLEPNNTPSKQQYYWSFDERRLTLDRQISSMDILSKGNIEREVRAFAQLASNIQTAFDHLEQKYFKLRTAAQKCTDKLNVHVNDMTQLSQRDIRYFISNTTNKVLNLVKNSVHLLVENPFCYKSFEIETPEKFIADFEARLKLALQSYKEGKQREFEERQSEKALQLAKIKEKEDLKLDELRNAEIERIKAALEKEQLKVRNDFAKELKRDRQKLQESKVEMENQVEQKLLRLKEKEEEIELILKKRQAELMKELLANSDSIINQEVEARVAETLKTLGLEL